MAKRFLGTNVDGTPLFGDPEANEAKRNALLASMTREEFIRHLRKRGLLDCIMMLNNGEPSVAAPYRDCYHPYDSDGLPDLDKLVDIDGNPVPFPRKARRRRKHLADDRRPRYI